MRGDEGGAVRAALCLRRGEPHDEGDAAAREHRVDERTRQPAVAVREGVERQQVVPCPRRLGDGAHVVARRERLQLAWLGLGLGIGLGLGLG